MNHTENSHIQGILLNAVEHQGEAALWKIARSNKHMSATVLEVLELATSPHFELTLEDAILIVTNKSKNREVTTR